MADSASLGDLFVRISGNVDGLLSASKQATGALEQMSAGGGRFASGMALSAGVAAGAFLVMAKTIASALDGIINKFVETGKTAQQLGLTVEELSKLQFAARKAGISADELTMGIQDFAKQAGEVRSGIEPMDNFQLALARIGVNFQNLNNQKPTTLLLEIADRFSRMEDGVRKTRTAIDLFGRSGSELIAFLNQGKPAIQAYMAELEDLGDVLSKDTAQQALKFKMTLDSISDSFDRVLKRLVGEFLPMMDNLAQQFASAVKNTNNMSLAMDGLRVVFNVFVGAGQAVLGIIKGIVEGIGGAARLLKAIATGDWKAAMDAYRDTTTTAFSSMFEGIIDGTKTALGLSKGELGKWETQVHSSTENAKKDFKQLDLTAKQAAESQALARKNFVEALVLTPGPTVFAIQAIDRALKLGKIGLAEYTQAMDEALGNERRFQLLQLDDVMSKTSASMQEKLEALRTALRNGSISWSTYGKSVRDVENQNRDQMLETATMAASTISAVFKNNKGASIAAAIINTAVGITKALAQGGMWGWAQAALIGAAGVAQVAAISNTNEDGSGGGAANVSSSGAAAAAAPAEAPAQEQRTLFVQGFNKNEFFDGETAAGIARSLVQYQKDGGTVVIK